MANQSLLNLRDAMREDKDMPGRQCVLSGCTVKNGKVTAAQTVLLKLEEGVITVEELKNKGITIPMWRFAEIVEGVQKTVQ